ncbi:molybdenum ABC transporter ATP-binding protein [Oryzifoliimicrobium ureilyticus]|uniref:molybdenum ABC transporter ATP-binding protein n=1 Tax=Oryzifoliimicrobium ureilyticus TaxID=3113724 RepID=UPI0030762D32
MTLFVDVDHRLGTFSLKASFTSEGGVTALFGRSGSGKTSLVKTIAGLIRAKNARIELEGDVLEDTQAGRFVPAHRRRFGYVFQEPRLFPHLSVRRNLTYGRWLSPKGERVADPDQVIAILGIEPLLDRMPAKLSGGEKQRVAIGRALLSSPRMLLMDEPLSALDETRRAEILPYLERLRDETRLPMIYVSHSISEVARLADRVILMDHGTVEAVGSPEEVLSRASSFEGGRQSGVVLEGRVVSMDPANGLASVRLRTATLVVPANGLSSDRKVRLHIPARDVMLATLRPEGLSALNILEGRIVEISKIDDAAANVKVDCGGDVVTARITAYSAERLSLAPDKIVFAIIKTVAIER